ncbi:MAG: TraB/GumN family protein [Robiginitomaculum sp.]
MFVKTLKWICLAAIFVALNGCGGNDSVQSRVERAHKRNDGPAIWKVTDSNSTLYLFGSVHMFPDNTDWQRRDMQAAFSSVGTVFFETPDDLEADLEMSLLQQKLGQYPSGERLSDHLDSLMLKRMTAAAHNSGIPQTALEAFKPWLVADLLTIAAANQAGLHAENSVDVVMREKAKFAKKHIIALDDNKTYIEAVALQPDWVQIENLAAIITDFDTVGDDMRRVNEQWLVGNVPFIEERMILPYKEKNPEMYETLFKNRNERWGETLDKFMRGDTSAMVVVGIGHLVGPDSLIVQLRERGYTAKRERRFDLPN